MSIEVVCQCGRLLRAADRQAGRRCRCPGCGQIVIVPMPVLTDINPEPAQRIEQNDPAGMDHLGELARAVGVRDIEAPVEAAAAPVLPAVIQPAAVPAQTVAPARVLQYADRETRRRPEPQVHGPAPRILNAPAPESIRRIERGWRGQGYWLLLLMLIPLAVLTFRPHLTLEQRLAQTIKAHPNIAWGDTSPEDLTLERLDGMLAQLPGHRLDGALLSRQSVWHWLMALGSAGLFTLLVTYAMPTSGDDDPSGALLQARGSIYSIRPKRIFLTGLFTGTLGVLTLLAIQFFGMFCCIGLFYAAALNPTAPFGPSLLGFILGVGICEEIVKCLPVLWLLFRGHLMSWREACVIGMASGAGFGVSEGILYATRLYNGIEPADIYIVRFCSSVAFHTILTGACALLIQRKQEHLLEKMDPVNWILTLTAIILIPIALHGLFDTLAKQQLPAGSLAVSLVAFVWLARLIKQARRSEAAEVTQIAQGPKIVRTEKGTRYIAPS